MKRIFLNHTVSGIASAIVTILLGVVLTAWPDRSVGFLCSLLGGVIFVLGVFYILGDIARRRQGFHRVFTMLPGVVLIALGLWMMASPMGIIAVVQYVFGLVVIFHGALNLYSVTMLLRARARRWWVELLLAVATIGLGLLILFNPFETFGTLVVLIGIVLIFDGISDLWIAIRVARNRIDDAPAKTVDASPDETADGEPQND